MVFMLLAYSDHILEQRRYYILGIAIVPDGRRIASFHILFYNGETVLYFLIVLKDKIKAIKGKIRNGCKTLLPGQHKLYVVNI